MFADTWKWALHGASQTTPESGTEKQAGIHFHKVPSDSNLQPVKQVVDILPLGRLGRTDHAGGVALVVRIGGGQRLLAGG